MGDRGNICIREGKEEVYLYTHWEGSDIFNDLRTALGRRQRWDDAPYLTRIIFDTMSAGAQGEDTGYGIWATQCDNEHSIPVVDVTNQMVYIMPADWDGKDTDKRFLRKFTFEEYLANDTPLKLKGL